MNQRKAEKNLFYNQSAITLIALVISIIVMLVLAGVSLNATVGENGIITRAQNAKLEMEEAELWEQIQMVFADATAQGLEGQELVDYCNAQFAEKGLEASMSFVDGEYLLTYGKYSRVSQFLSLNLTDDGSFEPVEGSSDLWKTELKSDGTLKIIAYKGEKSGDIVIPNIINGFLVTELGSSVFTNAKNITSITISDKLQTIGDNAFYNCTGIYCDITFPSSLTSIGSYAFYNCTGLGADLNVIVSQGITMGKNAFANCSRLTGDISVLIAGLEDSQTEITDGMFSGFSGLTGDLVIPKRITSIGDYAFSGCSGIETISFEDSSALTNIGSYAFYQCSSMESDLVIPTNVTSIGDYAFKDDAKIKSLQLNSKITYIGEYAFYGCSNMAGTSSMTTSTSGTVYALTIPNTIDTINPFAFYKCTNLKGLIFESKGSSDTSESLTIGNQGFSNCTAIVEITFPSDRKVYVSGQSAFSTNSSLVTINNATQIYSVGSSAFSSCKLLVTMPSQTNCTTISSSAFSSCTALSLNITEWLVSSYVTSVGDSAFSGCSNLTGSYSGSITSKSGKMTLGQNVFYGTQVANAVVLDLDGVTTITASQFANATAFTDADGGAISGAIEIPSSVTTISSKAFYGCTAITSVIIPSSVTSIGSYAFSGCKNLKSVTWNTSLTSIPSYCFYNTGITSFDFSSITTVGETSFFYSSLSGSLDLSSVTSIGKYAFKSTKIQSVTFGSNLTSIGVHSFRNCTSLNCAITVPSSVTTVGNSAFSCTKITSLVFSGSNTQITPGVWSSGDGYGCRIV